MVTFPPSPLLTDRRDRGRRIDALIQVLHLALQGGDIAGGLDAEHIELFIGRRVAIARLVVLRAL